MKSLLPVLALIMLLLFGCISVDLSEVAISKLDLSLSNNLVSSTRSLTPGQSYKVSIDLYDIGGERIGNWDEGQISLVSPNATLEVHRVPFIGYVASSMGNTWKLAQAGSFTLEARIKGNAFPPASFEWPINWDAFNRIGVEGMDGKAGTSGANGRDGDPSSNKTIDGGNGTDGEDGSDGVDARNITLIVAYYDTDRFQKMMLLYNVEKNELSLSTFHRFSIDASGGDGGNGGNGGDAGRGARYERPKAPPSPAEIWIGRNGLPGNGGNGGHGGNGGVVTIWYYDPLLYDFLSPIVDGGQPGAGGKRGSSDFALAARARDGRDGMYGRPGYVVAAQKPYEEIVRFLDLLKIKDLDITRITES